MSVLEYIVIIDTKSMGEPVIKLAAMAADIEAFIDMLDESEAKFLGLSSSSPNNVKEMNE